MNEAAATADLSLAPVLPSLIYPDTGKGIIYQINEERFIAQYVELTGANESLARNIYMHLEPAQYRALAF